MLAIPRKYTWTFGGNFSSRTTGKYSVSKSATVRSAVCLTASAWGIPSFLSLPYVTSSNASNLVNIATTGTAKNGLQTIISTRNNVLLTTPCTGLCKETPLCCCERPFVIHRDAVPMGGKKWIGRNFKLTITHHMTCNCSLRSTIFDLSIMNCFTLLSSSTAPASKPRESWKTNPGLLLNTSSLLTSCIPRWENISSSLV